MLTVSERLCPYCGSVKPITDFYMASKTRRERQCKQCRRNREIALRESNPTKFRARKADASRKSIAKHYKRTIARYTVNNAIRAGKLIPTPCVVCGETAEAHHPDYDAPLDVVWLCRTHHREAHSIAQTEAHDA